MKVNEAGEFEITWPYGDSMELYKGILSAGKRFKEEKEAKHFIPLPTWTWPFRNNVTVHPLGGCVLADDEVGGVTNSRLDKFGEVFGYRGLYVADGAIVPSAVGSNPVATICALSEMVAEGITQISPDASLV
jgi:cholesterol oxidase